MRSKVGDLVGVDKKSSSFCPPQNRSSRRGCSQGAWKQALEGGCVRARVILLYETPAQTPVRAGRRYLGALAAIPHGTVFNTDNSGWLMKTLTFSTMSSFHLKIGSKHLCKCYPQLSNAWCGLCKCPAVSVLNCGWCISLVLRWAQCSVKSFGCQFCYWVVQ